MNFKLKILKYWLEILLTPKCNSRKDVEVYQAKMMNHFAQRVLSKSAYYKHYFQKEGFNWSTVPLISKTEFMNSFDEINTVGIKKEEALQVALDAENSREFSNEIAGITVGLSTGTSGKRGLFLVSENERALWVALVMNRVIKPKLFKKQKVAFFLRANSNLYSSVESNLFEFKYFDIFKSMNELLMELNSYQPDVLASQPSVLMDVVMAQKRQQININPTQIISFAEVLHTNDKEIIESVLGVKITEVYQCTEGFLGVSCKYGTMHLNEDFIHFDKQWIDEDKFYPIVTDFSRESQPVVNYRMNDILQIKKEQCKCGSKLLAIEKIIGRDDDVLILNGLKLYPDLVARRIAQQTDLFQKYTIVQVKRNQLIVGIECENNAFESVKIIFESVLNQLFSEFSISDVILSFENRIDATSGNKTRKIKRLNDEN